VISEHGFGGTVVWYNYLMRFQLEQEHDKSYCTIHVWY
jgi:hypothetical protein